MGLFGRETERDQQRAEAWARWFRAQNPFAIASLVLGVFSLIEFGALVLPGIAGIVLGIVALMQVKRRSCAPEPEMIEESSATERRVGTVDYAPSDVPPPIRAIDYERPDEPACWTEGAKLAWAGIITSVLSLVLAGLLYARVFG